MQQPISIMKNHLAQIDFAIYETQFASYLWERLFFAVSLRKAGIRHGDLLHLWQFLVTLINHAVEMRPRL